MQGPVTQAFLDGLCALVAPARCYCCGGARRPTGDTSWTRFLCCECRDQVEVLAEACRGCGRAVGPHLRSPTRCSSCRGTTLQVRSTTALLRYRGPGRVLLRRLKYQGRCELAEPLGRALGRRFLARWPERARAEDLCVVPVPLHPWRRWRRGFNQAAAVARGVAAALECPVLEPLRRRRATRPLYGVHRSRRDAVLEDAFRSQPIHGRPVLLVDDIRTSGATLRAAARALRRAGVHRIDAAVVGR